MAPGCDPNILTRPLVKTHTRAQPFLGVSSVHEEGLCHFATKTCKSSVHNKGCDVGLANAASSTGTGADRDWG